MSARVGRAAMPAPPPDETFDYKPGRSLGYLVRDLHRAFIRALHARISRHGITVGQWFFLRVLWEEDGLTQRELSQRVGMMEPTTGTALNGMERRGIVKRVRDPADRRKLRVFLTEKGRRLRAALLPYAKAVNEVATRGISEPELKAVRGVLLRARGNLEDDAGPRPGSPGGRRRSPSR